MTLTAPRLTATLVFCAMVGGAEPTLGAAALELVHRGQPRATIVLGSQPTRAAQFAAYELQHHIRLITGARLPMVSETEPASGLRLYVGESAATRALGLASARFRPQEYAVRFAAGAIMLVGRDDPSTEHVIYDLDRPEACQSWPTFWEERGTLHAVYDFLERWCGVRWLNPTELGTSVKRTATLRVQARNIRRAPAFEFRDAIGATGDNPAAYDAYIALWPETADEFRAWDAEAYASLHRRFPDPGQYRNARAMLARLFLLRMRNGGKLVRCNHSLYGYYDRFWEPNPARPELFVKKRPELFAQGYEGRPPQMCYTSPELVQQLAQDARDYYDGKTTGAQQGIFWNPTLPNPFPVEPMDNASFCRCARCQAALRHPSQAGEGQFSSGLHSDYFFGFVNQVARELKKTHPDKPLVTLAYMTHAKRPSFRLEPNVAVQFCFASNRSPASRASYEHELALLKDWASEGVGRALYLWLYYTFPVETARSGKYHCFPGFFAHTIGEQFRLFHRLGIRGMFHCGYGQEVEAYLTFKLMDDPTLDVEQLLDDYLARLYGAAAEPMKQLYLAIERTYTDPALRPAKSVSGPELAWGYLGTAERMAEFQRLLDAAKALARRTTEKRNISLFEHAVWSYMVAGRAQYVQRKTSPIPAVRVPRVPPAAGDLSRVDWAQAAPLPGPWHDRGTASPSARPLSGRVAHDGTHLFLELTDPCETTKLVSSSTVFPFDDWEVFVAAQRDLPYRQYAVGPGGLVTALSHGEVNRRTNVPLESSGLIAASDTSAPDRWVVRLAVPLERVVAGGVAPGGTLYMNIIRVSSPAVSGAYPLGIDTWVSHCTVHEVDRLAELVLE